MVPRYLQGQMLAMIRCASKLCAAHKSRKITFRYVAVGQHGSIAVVERAIKTIKEYCTHLLLVPLRPDEFRTERDLFTA